MSKSRNQQIDNDEMVWDEGVEDVNPKLSPVFYQQKRAYRAKLEAKKEANAVARAAELNASPASAASAPASSSPALPGILPSPSQVLPWTAKEVEALQQVINSIEPFIREHKKNKISPKYQPSIDQIKDNFSKIEILYKKMQQDGYSNIIDSVLVFTNKIENVNALTLLENIKSACAALKNVSDNLFKKQSDILNQLEACCTNLKAQIRDLTSDLAQKFDNEKKAKLELHRVNAENLAAVTQTLENIVETLDQESTNLETAKEIENKIITWKKMPKKHVYFFANYGTCEKLIMEFSNSSMEEKILISHLENLIKLEIQRCEQQNEKALKKLSKLSDLDRVSASNIFAATPAEKEQAAFIIEENNITIGNLLVILELTQWKDCKLVDIAKTLNANMQVYPDTTSKRFLKNISDKLNERLGIEKKPSVSASSSL